MARAGKNMVFEYVHSTNRGAYFYNTITFLLLFQPHCLGVLGGGIFLALQEPVEFSRKDATVDGKAATSVNSYVEEGGQKYTDIIGQIYPTKSFIFINFLENDSKVDMSSLLVCEGREGVIMLIIPPFTDKERKHIHFGIIFKTIDKYDGFGQ